MVEIVANPPNPPERKPRLAGTSLRGTVGDLEVGHAAIAVGIELAHARVVASRAKADSDHQKDFQAYEADGKIYIKRVA